MQVADVSGEHTVFTFMPEDQNRHIHCRVNVVFEIIFLLVIVSFLMSVMPISNLYFLSELSDFQNNHKRTAVNSYAIESYVITFRLQSLFR